MALAQVQTKNSSPQSVNEHTSQAGKRTSVCRYLMFPSLTAPYSLYSRLLAQFRPIAHERDCTISLEFKHHNSIPFKADSTLGRIQIQAQDLLKLCEDREGLALNFG